VRIVLQVAVRRDDEPAARVREAGGEGRRLSKLRRKRITRRRESAACRPARISKLSSVLPSSTTMIS
jgi:hypothetical protein